MSLPTVQVLVLARLLASGDKGEPEKTLNKDLLPLVKHRWEAREWLDRFGSALDELEAAGTFRRIVKGKTTRFALSDEGRRLASEALGIADTSAKLTWAKIKANHLSALALGRPGKAVADLKVEILRSEYGLDLGEGKPTAKQAGDALASKLFGLEDGQKFTTDAILRKLLDDAGLPIPAKVKADPKAIGEALFRRELGDPSAKKPLDLLATRSVKAQNNKPAELVDAFLRSWIDRADPAPEASTELDLADFARRVSQAARTSPTGRFGDGKVFISHVHRGLVHDPDFAAMDDADFKDRLIQAHRSGLLELGRADLVEAMDPVDVRESSTPYQNAVYHFVRIEEPAR